MSPLFSSLGKKLKTLVSSVDYELRLGEVLVDRGVITRRQLREALNIQTDRYFRHHVSEPLGRIVVDAGMASEAEVVEAIREHYRVPAVALDEDLGELIRVKRESEAENPGLRLPLWLQYAAGATVIILALAVFANSPLDREVKRLVSERLEGGHDAVVRLAESSGAFLAAGDYAALMSTAEAAVAAGGLDYAAFIDEDEGVVAQAQAPGRQGFRAAAGPEDPLTVPFAPDGLSRGDGKTSMYWHVLPSGRRITGMSRPVIHDGRTVGEVRLAVGTDFIRAAGSRMKGFLWLSFLGVWVLSLAGAVFMGRAHAGRVKQVTDAAGAVARGDFRRRLSSTGMDEISDLTMSFNRMAQQVQKRLLSLDAFGRQVGAEVMEKVLGSPQSPWIKGQRANVSVLACRMPQLGSLVEKIPPEKAVEGANAVYAAMSRAVRDQGGYLERGAFGLVAVFGVPAPAEDHARRAARAALILREELAGSPDPLAGSAAMGVATGEVSAGFLSPDGDHLEYWFAGPAVDQALDLAGEAAPGEVLVSPQATRLLQDDFSLDQGGEKTSLKKEPR